MSQCAFAKLESSNRVVKRAQYEAFEFEIRNGGVLVRNNSHETPSDHEYLVTLTDGVPSACECPANARFDGACKHRVAVAIRKPVLDAAIDLQVAADGGQNVTTEKSSATNPGISAAFEDDAESESNDEVAEDCDCQYLPGDVPCWECYRTGRRDLPS